jgi:hypothetical protein
MDFAARTTLERPGRRPSADTVSRRAISPPDRRADEPGRQALIQAMRAGSTQAVQLAGPEDEELQMKRAPGVAQLAGPEDEELQMKRGPAVAQLEAARAAPLNDTGLPDQLKSGIENLSGMSMDGVKVHYNSSQPAQLNALAYAQGTNIHVAPGQEQHLPHEAWHVVQQAQGRVQPTMQMRSGVPVNDDAGLEQEADAMGARAMATPVDEVSPSGGSSV